MEKSQYELCTEVFHRLDNAGVLKDIILIGSWCIPFYREYFSDVTYTPTIKTRDVDFLIPAPSRIRRKVDIPELLKNLGFIISFKGSKGYIKLEHPKLIIEFLVPEKGRGLDKPYPLKQLGINAQTLRFLNFLHQNIITVKVADIKINLPHPANFALHKLIIHQRRKNAEKIAKDKDAAIMILKALIKKGESEVIVRTFKSIPQKWQKKIINGLDELKDKGIIEILI